MVTPFNNVSTNITVSDVFRIASKLTAIIVQRNSEDDFTINIGTTNGGDEIGSMLIRDSGNVLLVNHLFTDSQTIYITGLTGQNCNVFLEWMQLDEPPVPFVVPPQDALPKGAKMLWEGSAAEFAQKWDATTGLGKPNEGWSKWTIAGKNGTASMDNAYPVGIDTAAEGQDYLSLGS